VTAPKSQRVVAIDTMTLVWGIRRKGPEEKIKHAGYLFKELEQEEAQIIVPSVVVMEFITPMRSSEERANVIAALSERFLIEPFDVRDAALAADLWNYGKAKREMKKEGSRACLRADAIIVATAMNHGATEFYTEDDDCFNMANKVMTAKRLPVIAPNLFGGEPL
jgi:predicted nucleic acid-binding protein